MCEISFASYLAMLKDKLWNWFRTLLLCSTAQVSVQPFFFWYLKNRKHWGSCYYLVFKRGKKWYMLNSFTCVSQNWSFLWCHSCHDIISLLLNIKLAELQELHLSSRQLRSQTCSTLAHKCSLSNQNNTTVTPKRFECNWKKKIIPRSYKYERVLYWYPKIT